MGQSTLISGFTPIPITYPSTSASSSAVTHYIYARIHSGSKKVKDGLPDGRTLFLVNIPPDATEREVVKLFKSAGMVEKVVFGVEDVEEVGRDAEDDEEEEEEEEGAESEKAMIVEGENPKKRRKIPKEETPKVVPLPTAPLRTLRKTGGTAHVVFLDSSSLDRAVNSLSKPRSWPTAIEKEEEPIGLSHYLSLYDSLRPPLDAVREHADTYIAAFEYELAKARQKSQYKKGEAIVDEDGFTLVTRGGAYGQTLGGGVAVASKRFQQTGETRTRSNKRKEKREKEDFYAFQKAEKQRKGEILVTFAVVSFHLTACVQRYWI
jgi:ribosomal RNA-processing protein 7